jgi:hypothetical protein
VQPGGDAARNRSVMNKDIKAIEEGFLKPQIKNNLSWVANNKPIN